jgi:hypothetical protein
MLTEADLQPDGMRKTSKISGAKRPLLLSIPQELRDKIFSYVYNTFDADDTVFLRFKTPDQAGVEWNDAPPTKNALLVCKQIHAEQKKVQAAAYRRFWTVQKFIVMVGNCSTRKRLHLVTKTDLQHICRLVFHYSDYHYTYVLVTFSFDALNAWTVNIEPWRSWSFTDTTNPPWFLADCPRRNNLVQDLKEMMDTFREDYGGYGNNEYFDDTTVDPTYGQGLDAIELNQLPSIVNEYG